MLPLHAGIPDGATSLRAWDDAPVRVCLLGSFRVVKNRQLVTVRSGGKTEALLARLGLAGRKGIARDALLRSVWPQSELALATQALTTLVHSLRNLLGEALAGETPVLLRAGHYWLNESAGVAVDVMRFRELVSRGEQCESTGDLDAALKQYEQAIRVYVGDLTVAVGSGAGPTLERERLRATSSRVLIRLADYSFARDDFAASLRHVMELLSYDPWREDAHRLVMRCHVRLGARSEALRHYRTVQAILRTEVGAEPEPATTALFDKIRLTPADV